MKGFWNALHCIALLCIVLHCFGLHCIGEEKPRGEVTCSISSAYWCQYHWWKGCLLVWSLIEVLIKVVILKRRHSFLIHSLLCWSSWQPCSKQVRPVCLKVAMMLFLRELCGIDGFWWSCTWWWKHTPLRVPRWQTDKLFSNPALNIFSKIKEIHRIYDNSCYQTKNVAALIMGVYGGLLLERG